MSINDLSVVENSLALFPNPITKGNDNVKLNVLVGFSDSNAFLELYTMQGKRLSHQPLKVTSGSNEFSLKVSDKLSSGVYLVKLTTKGFVKTIRLVIE